MILKGQKGSFEATIVLKEDFTTGFEFSEKKKTNFKKRTRRTAKRLHYRLMRNTTHKQQEIENQKAKIRSEQEKMRASKRRLQQLKNQQRIQKEIELDR
ncbi:hypothetical protein EfmAA55_28710 (plasmid) [Enterococcus faecium]|nr:hypothetical protein EfmAA55_28710 [Enterococcus faecium]